MKHLLIIFFFLGFLSCNNRKTILVEDIVISYEFIEFTHRSSFPYINVLKKSIQGDKNCLLKLIRFAYKTDDQNAIEHGIIFSKAVQKLGDNKFLNFIKNQDEEYKELSVKMFNAGIEFDSELSNLKNKLPSTFQLLFNK
jgi:hypothetical protein